MFSPAMLGPYDEHCGYRTKKHPFLLQGSSGLFPTVLFKLFSDSVFTVPPGHKVNDGLWHSVTLDTQNLQLSLVLDNIPASTIELGEHLDAVDHVYFGGRSLWELVVVVVVGGGCNHL